uniref:PITH domain-containing protein 1 n=1 Tax=Eptatretus burgeri TaxID=7764 RepID=A0A8C4QC29_EPTBU
MAGHGHSHGGGGCSCGGNEGSEGTGPGGGFGLYLRIDKDNVECLNEAREGSGQEVLRAWDERTDRSKYVESDVDQELLFNIPFLGSVRLHGVVVMGEEGGAHPAEMRLFKNIPHMTFDDTGREADQEFGMSHDLTGTLEYPTKATRFSNVSHLSMHFSKNFGAENTKIYYIGLRGDWMQAHRHEVTICTYEASANPADHKTPSFTPQTHLIS